MNIDAFQIRHIRSFTDDVCLKYQTTFIEHYPDAALLDAPRRAKTKAAGIASQRANAAFFKGHRRIHGHDFVDVFNCRRPQVNRTFYFRIEFFQFEQVLATNQAWYLARAGKALPESLDR